MRGRAIMTGLFLAAALALSGCAVMDGPTQPLEFKPHAFATGQYAPKVDNFQIIIDASQSMDPAVYYTYKYPTAKNFVEAVNQSIPTDLKFNGGLRSFGHNPKQSKNPTDLVYGMTQYTRNGLAEGLNSIKHLGGMTPLDKALAAAGQDLAKTSGPAALVIVSDGVNTSGVPAVAAKIKSELGDRVCIYTVWVGGRMEGKLLLEQVAKAGKCGYASTAAELTAPDKFKKFVEDVFLAQKAAPAPVAKAPPADSDGDGVPDDRDKCPGTLPGVMVDADGCDLKFTLQIEFDFDKADIRPEYHDKIAEAAAFIKKYPETQILIAGHTDSMGDEAYNKQLSLQRAAALETYLVEKFGAKDARLFPRGYGESRPIATNDTPEGRQQNRRVEFICCVVIPPEN